MTTEITTYENQPNAMIQTINTVQGTPEGRKLVANAVNNADSLAQYEGVVLKISNVLTRPGMRGDLDGNNQTPCQCTYLIDTDGKAYFSQSDGVARSINTIMDIYRDFPKDTENGEYAEMALRSQTLPNGRTIKSIELV